MILTKQNLPFSGQQEDIYSFNKGNFIKLVELMKKYDPVLGKYYMKEIHDNRLYLSLKIQNELIHILGKHLEENILNRIRKANNPVG